MFMCVLLSFLTLLVPSISYLTVEVTQAIGLIAWGLRKAFRCCFSGFLILSGRLRIDLGIGLVNHLRRRIFSSGTGGFKSVASSRESVSCATVENKSLLIQSIPIT